MESNVPTFTVDGVSYPFAQDLRLGEAREIKRIYGVLLGDLEALLTVGDPDALAASVYVSMRRVNPELTEADVENVDIGSLAASLTADAPEGEDGPPPVAAAAE